LKIFYSFLLFSKKIMCGLVFLKKTNLYFDE